MGISFFNLDFSSYEYILKEVTLFFNEISKIFKKDLDIKIFFLDSRRGFDKNFGGKTEEWMVGFSNKNRINLISPKFINKLSSHKMKRKGYVKLINHEIAHCFYDSYKNKNDKFHECVAMWLSRNFLIKETKKNRTKELNELLNSPKDYINASTLAIFLYYLEKKFKIDKGQLLIELSKEEIAKKYSSEWKDFSSKWFWDADDPNTW